MKVAKVAVVGAGVSGLLAARRLHDAGVTPHVYEAAPHIGGRLHTHVHPDGFLLDHGFQVLLDAYPAVRRDLDLERLSLRSFPPGATLVAENRPPRRLADPRRRPRDLPALLGSKVARPADLARLAPEVLKQALSGPYATLGDAATAESADSYLRRLGLSAALVDGFVRPFCEAIFVSPLAQQDARVLRFVLRSLALGSASLPARGMRAVPEQLAEGLDGSCVRLGSRVEEVGARGLRLCGADEPWREYSAVVVATDWSAAAGLLGLPPESLRSTRSATWYFAAPEEDADDFLVLQGYDEGGVGSDCSATPRVVNVAFPSAIQPSYAPEGRALAAVAVSGPMGVNEAWVREQLRRLLPDKAVCEWRLLRCVDVPRHQPMQWPRATRFAPFVQHEGVFACGDWVAEPTLDGALRSGAAAAEAVLARTTKL